MYNVYHTNLPTNITPKEALDSWPPAAPLVKKEVLLPSMLGRDSWGRQRRLYDQHWSLALTVNTLRSNKSK